MSTSHHQRAFSMTELLVVIGIIALLMAILVPVLQMVRFQAKVVGTNQRMQQIITALADYSAGDRTVSALQRAAGLGAPSQLMSWQTVINSLPAAQPVAGRPPAFTGLQGDQQALRGEQTLEVLPAAGFTVPNAAWWTSQWPYLWPTTDWMATTPGSVPPVIPYPWGRPGLCLDLLPTTPGAGTGDTGRRTPAAAVVNNLYMIGSGTSSTAVAASQSVTRSDGTSVTVTGDNPFPFDLGYASPLRTVDLLQAIAILDAGSAGTTAYGTDRNTNRPWNDLWGNPLIISYALFHPARDDNSGLRDRYFKGALKQHGYGKAVYIAIGATGPALRAGIATDASTATSLRDRWFQIRDTCRAADWTELSWNAPPSNWKEYRKASQTIGGNKETCLLTAPLELKP